MMAVTIMLDASLNINADPGVNHVAVNRCADMCVCVYTHVHVGQGTHVLHTNYIYIYTHTYIDTVSYYVETSIWDCALPKPAPRLTVSFKSSTYWLGSTRLGNRQLGSYPQAFNCSHMHSSCPIISTHPPDCDPAFTSRVTL